MTELQRSLSVLIADDEPLARERLARLLQGMEGFRLLRPLACNGVEALELAQRLAPDVLLLDIRMPGLDGLQVAERLCAQERAPAVIFCTAFDAFALEAFRHSAAGYLLKPVRAGELQSALKNAQRLSRAQLAALREAQVAAQPAAPEAVRTHVSVQSHRGLERIELSRVLCFVAGQKYVTLHHEGGQVLMDEPLKVLEEEFSADFLRVHRNALVAKKRIERLHRSPLGAFELYLRGQHWPLAVSRRHVAALRQWIKVAD